MITQRLKVEKEEATGTANFFPNQGVTPSFIDVTMTTGVPELNDLLRSNRYISPETYVTSVSSLGSSQYRISISRPTLDLGVNEVLTFLQPTGNLIKDDGSLFIAYGHNYNNIRNQLIEESWENELYAGGTQASKKVAKVSSYIQTTLPQTIFGSIVIQPYRINLTVDPDHNLMPNDKVILSNIADAYEINGKQQFDFNGYIDNFDLNQIVAVSSDNKTITIDISWPANSIPSNLPTSGVNYSVKGIVAFPSTIETDLAILNAAGSNIVRICLQLDKFMTSKNSFNQNQFNKLNEFLDLAAKYDIYVIVNGANTWVSANQPDWLNFISEQDRWQAQANFWQEIARRFGHHPAIAWYSLINEPLDNSNQDAKIASIEENDNGTIDIYSESNTASYVGDRQGAGYAIISNQNNDAFELVTYESIGFTSSDLEASEGEENGFYLRNATKFQYGNYNRISNDNLPNCYISFINKLPNITNLKVRQTTANSKEVKIDIAADESFKSFQPSAANIYQNNISFFGNSYASAVTSNYIVKTANSQFNSGVTFIGVTNAAGSAPATGDYVSGNGISTSAPVTIVNPVTPFPAGSTTSFLMTISSPTTSNQTNTLLTFETPSQLIGVTGRNKRYSTRLTSILSSTIGQTLTEKNYASQNAILSSPSGYGQIFQNLPNGNQETQNPISGFTYRIHSINFGKDDYLAYGQNYGYNANFFIQTLRVVLSRLRSNAVTELSASNTPSGNFVNITDANASGGSYLRVTNSGGTSNTYSYPTISTSANFAGGTIAIGFMIENGKSAQVKITLNKNIAGKERIYRQSLISGVDVRSGITAPVIQRIPDVLSGVNTIDIEFTVAAGSTACLDYWQIESLSPAPIIVHNILEFESTMESVSRWNEEIEQLIFNEFFNESVFYFDLNSGPVLNTPNDINANIWIDGTDLVNGVINDAGHSRIADACKTLLSSNGLLFTSGVAVDGTTYTYNTAVDHNLVTNDIVIIKNVTPATSNGAFKVISTNGSRQFSVTGVANPSGLSAINGQFSKSALIPNTSYFIESASLPSSSKLRFVTNDIVGLVDSNGRYTINVSNTTGITTSTTAQTCLVYNNGQWINKAYLGLDRHYTPYVTLTTRGRSSTTIATSWINQMINYIKWQDPSTKLTPNDLFTPITVGVIPGVAFDNNTLLDIRSPHQYLGGNMAQMVDTLKARSGRQPVILEEGAIPWSPDYSPRTVVNYLLKSKKYLAGALNNYQAHGVWKTDPYNFKYAITFDIGKPFFKDAITDDTDKTISIGLTSPNVNVPSVTGNRFLTPVFDQDTVVISGSVVSSSQDPLPAKTYRYIVAPEIGAADLTSLTSNLSRASNTVDIAVNGKQKPRLRWPTINFDESVNKIDDTLDPFANVESFHVYRYCGSGFASRPDPTTNPTEHYYYVGNISNAWRGQSDRLYQFTDTYAGDASSEIEYKGFDIDVLDDNLSSTATRVPIKNPNVFRGYNKICIKGEIMYYSRIYQSGGQYYLDVGEPLQTGTMTGANGGTSLTFSAGIPQDEFGTPLWVPGMTLVKSGTISGLPNSAKIIDVDVTNKKIIIGTALTATINSISLDSEKYVTGGRGRTTDPNGADDHNVGTNIYQIFSNDDLAREKVFDFYTSASVGFIVIPTDPYQPTNFYGVAQNGSYIAQTQLTKSPSIPSLSSVTYVNSTTPTNKSLTFHLNSIKPGYNRVVNSFKTRAYIKIANVSASSPSEAMRIKLYDSENDIELNNARLTINKTSGTNWLTSNSQAFNQNNLDRLQLINSISTKDLRFTTPATDRNLSIFTEYVEVNMTEKLSRLGTPVATIV